MVSGTRKPADCRARVILMAPMAALLVAAGPEGMDLASPVVVGSTVVLKGPETTLRDGDRVVGTNVRHRPYRVAKVDGDRLRLVADGVGVEGWVGRDQAVVFDDAIRQDTGAIREHPDSARAYHHRALLWYDQGEIEIAIRDYDESIGLDPKDAVARVNRGIAWAAKKDYAKAIVDFDDAIRLDRGLAAAYAERGIAHDRSRNALRAVADYERAIVLDPDCAVAMNGLAWLLATAPEAGLRDGGKAIELAKRANELTNWRNAYFLGTLAAACAEGNDFFAAERWQVRALDLFPKDVPALEAHRDRLKSYRSKRPYHEGASRP